MNSKLYWSFFNTETDVSVLVHTFQGKMKTHWKHSISPAMAYCSNTSEVCLSFSVWSLWNKNCSYSTLQVETPASAKQHFEACAHHLHISLQGQPDMLSPTNQKYIKVSLFYFHDVTPHSQPLTPTKKRKNLVGLFIRNLNLLCMKKCLIKWQILIDMCKFMSA